MSLDVKQIATGMIIGLLKVFILIYDIVTYPIYLIAYRPWTKLSIASNVTAAKENPSDRSSAWTSSVKLDENSLANGANSLAELFKKVTGKFGEKMCLGYRDVFMKDEEVVHGATILKKIPSPDFKWFTYDQVDKRIDDIVKGLIKHQITCSDKVVVYMENRIEHTLVIHAILRLGAVAVVVNEQVCKEELQFILNQVESCKIFTSSLLLERLESVLPEVNFEKTIFYAEDASETKRDTTAVSYVELLEIGSNESPSFEVTKKGLSDLAIIYYTQNEQIVQSLAKAATMSSEGNVPAQMNNQVTTKGVMLTNENLISAIWSLDSVVAKYLAKNKLADSQFPAHLTSLADLICVHVMLSNGIPVAFSTPGTLTDESDSLKSGSRGDLSCIKGKVINSVPSFLDTIRRDFTHENENAVGSFKRSFFQFALAYKTYWQMKGFNTPIMNAILLGKLKSKMSKHLQLIINRIQGELLSPTTESFIRSTVNCDIINGSAATETCGFFTLKSPFDLITIGSVGSVLPGYKVKLDDWTAGGFTSYDLPHPRGEILVSGPAVSSGYFGQVGNNNNNNNNNNESSDQSLDDESFVTDETGVKWYRSGFIGEIRPNGQLYIYDKKDSMVRLEYGRSLLSLGQIEATIRSNSFIKHIFCYANDENNFIIALINPCGKAIRGLCSSLDIEEGSLSFKEMCSDPEIQAEVTKSIIEFGVKNQLSKTVLPSKVKLCPEMWTTETNFLLPDFTLNRSKIVNFYHKDISRMFNTGRKQIIPQSVSSCNNNNNNSNSQMPEPSVTNANTMQVTVVEVNDTSNSTNNVVETKAGVEMSDLKTKKKGEKGKSLKASSPSSSSSSSESEYSEPETSFGESKSHL